MGSSKPPPLLTREKAESIPFSVKDLPYILRYFSFSPGSPQAKAMQETLQSCEGETMEGETRICATSLESMLDFVSESFGHKSRSHALTTRHKTDPKWEFVQNYTIIQAPKEVSSSRIVACHPLSYPYSVYLCHYQHGNKVLKVSLADENGDQIEAVATCHMDTSKWYPGHISFAILGTRPGSAEACHFFPVYHVAWVPADS
ncbi:hypothetical protein Tsubulata_003415 [Turnera subulata]|uniref:BURP domain-containing protein n=1 Tax=Turnera subulata TaxID=218843 RepID=A0A9Q0J724_9ROSI|nr:hypothetical protein Tsubulata_003415 [Turnera subulata]